MKQPEPAPLPPAGPHAEGMAAWSLRLCREWARQRKNGGHYDRTTLAAYRMAARTSGRGSDLVAYLAFRRDMGWPPHRHHLSLLRRVLPSLGPRVWLEAYNLIVEAGGAPPALPLHLQPLARRLCAASPPLSAMLAKRGLVRASPFLSALAALARDQQARRSTFSDYLRAAPSICVVGNHAGMTGSGLGRKIDAHARVVRFNQFRSAHSRPSDLGEKTDIWVRMPGIAREGVDFTGDWVVISGPDLRYRLSNWAVARAPLERGTPMLTVPLDVWRPLVETLEAPPTAGLLFLAWLRQLRDGGLRGVSIAGFQRTEDAVGAYHHAIPGKRPGPRHDWALERSLLARWVVCDGARWL